MSQRHSSNFRFLLNALLLGFGLAVLATACLPDPRDGGGGGNGGEDCFSDVDCDAGEEFCYREDPTSFDGACAPKVAEGGSCLLGSNCVSDLFCLVDSSEGEGVCRSAPSACSDGPDCNCEPMLDMCAPGGLSCDGPEDVPVTLYCNNGPGSGIGDDDDTGGLGDDDDDDDIGDDDTGGGEVAFNGLTFSIEFSATPGVAGAAGVAATYKFSYWDDYQNQILSCVQAINIEGSAIFGAGMVTGCNNCTGKIDFDDSTAVDASAAEPSDGCDVAELEDAGANFGSALLTSITNGGYGDFLSMALVDATTMGSLGLDLAVAGGYSAADMAATWADYDLEFTHAGYVDNQVGTLSESSGLDAVAANAGGTSNWYGYWQLFKNPATNTHPGADLSGEYGGQAVWVITFNPE